jgi:CheY-like chemotaxis protein
MSFLDKTPRLDDVCVLVIEDAAAVRDVVVVALELSGARVIAVDSALEGLAVLKREMPDVIVTSLTMPGHDGYWFLRQVRSLPAERGGRTPVAAFTGCTTREDRLKALRAGFEDYLAKPADLSQLVEVVALLSLRGKTRVLAH